MGVEIEFDGGAVYSCGLEFVGESFDRRGAARKIEEIAVRVETGEGIGFPCKWDVSSGKIGKGDAR